RRFMRAQYRMSPVTATPKLTLRALEARLGRMQRCEGCFVDADVRALANLLEQLAAGLCLFVGERAARDVVLHLVEGALPRPAAPQHLEQVVPVARLHDARHLPRLQREARVVELPRHRAAGEPAEIPSPLRIRRSAVRPRQLLE